jgi:hypothetical protein
MRGWLRDDVRGPKAAPYREREHEAAEPGARVGSPTSGFFRGRPAGLGPPFGQDALRHPFDHSGDDCVGLRDDGETPLRGIRAAKLALNRASGSARDPGPCARPVAGMPDMRQLKTSLQLEPHEFHCPVVRIGGDFIRRFFYSYCHRTFLVRSPPTK